MPMRPQKTVLQSTQSTGIFKDADNGEKQKITFFMAEIMVSGRVWWLSSLCLLQGSEQAKEQKE